jgi:hypothetical protein
MGGASMNDIETPVPEDGEDEPTLSELLAEEIRTGSDASTVTDALLQTIDDGVLPPKVAELLTPATFTDAVFEEVDWLVAEGAVLPVTTRARLLSAVDRALELKRANDMIQQDLQDLFTEAPDELSAAPAAELRGLLDAIESGQVAAHNFRPAHVAELVFSASINPFVAFAAFSLRIRSTQTVRSDQIPVLGRRPSDEWEDQLQQLRQYLLP